MPTECIFCNIAAGKTDTRFIRETENLVVFNDINPHAPVHQLIVPKRHIRSINDLGDEDQQIVSELIFAGKEAAVAAGVAASGYKLVFNVERGGGQVIFHLHLHLVGGWKR